MAKQSKQSENPAVMAGKGLGVGTLLGGGLGAIGGLGMGMTDDEATIRSILGKMISGGALGAAAGAGAGGLAGYGLSRQLQDKASPSMSSTLHGLYDEAAPSVSRLFE